MRWIAGPAARDGGGATPTSVILGAEHPLTRAIAASECVWRQIRAVAAVLVAGVIDVLLGRAWAATLVGSSAAVLAGLVAVAAACRGSQREHALGVIIEGRDGIPVAAVQRQRTRLGDERTRRDLSRSLEEIVRQGTSRRRRSCRIPPLFEPAVIAPVADDLLMISRLLLEREAHVRGVAVAEKLVTRATSPLYGRDVGELRDELRRIECLLTGAWSA
jgi:hypothetical protein